MKKADPSRVLDLAQQLQQVVEKAHRRTVDPDTGKFQLMNHTLALYMVPGQMEIVYVVVKGALDPEMQCYPIALPGVLHTLVGFMAQLEKETAGRMSMTPDALIPPGKGPLSA